MMNSLRMSLMERLLNRPLALNAGRAEALLASLGLMSPFDDDQDAFDRGYDISEDGVALIRVQGVLVQKIGTCWSWGFMTGYDGIWANFYDAMNNEMVKAIVLDIDSGGGESCGCFDLVDMIFAARGKKPIWAILNECAYSAAYAIASACDRIFVPRTGGAGSIGVILMLADITGALDQAGIKVNLIQFGARKADGSPMVALTAAARAKFQADVDTLGEMFAETVARNRGMKPADVIAQQAACYMGDAAVQAGLADKVAAPVAAFAELLATIKS